MTSAFYWCNNDGANKATYGVLYNWYTVETKNLCPIGRHVPTQLEWDLLESSLGGNNVAGYKMKEVDTIHWWQNIGGTNESGFTGLPGGLRSGKGKFGEIFSLGRWWLAEDFSTVAYFRGIYEGASYVGKGTSDKGTGYSIRCIMN